MAARRGEGSFFVGHISLKLSKTATLVPKVLDLSWSIWKVLMFFLRGVLRTFLSFWKERKATTFRVM